jgi:hypothetical protein
VIYRELAKRPGDEVASLLYAGVTGQLLALKVNKARAYPKTDLVMKGLVG